MPATPAIRLLPCGDAPALAAHVRRLQEEGPVVFVAAERPARAWEPVWHEAGVDRARLHVVDAVAAMNGRQPGPRSPGVVFLPSPVMLEMMALRAEQLAQRHGAVRVVVDSLDTLVLYNGASAVQAFAHYLGSRLRALGVGADLVLCDTAASPGARDLRGRLAPFVDGVGSLEAQA